MKVPHVKDFVLSKLEHGYYTFPLKEVENGSGIAGRSGISSGFEGGWAY